MVSDVNVLQATRFLMVTGLANESSDLVFVGLVKLFIIVGVKVGLNKLSESNVIEFFTNIPLFSEFLHLVLLEEGHCTKFMTPIGSIAPSKGAIQAFMEGVDDNILIVW